MAFGDSVDMGYVEITLHGFVLGTCTVEFLSEGAKRCDVIEVRC